MDDEIQLISDGEGLAVIGDDRAVERFLAAEGLPSENLGLPRLSQTMAAGAGATQAAASISANSGRWVKLTKESAETVRKYGLRQNATSGVSTGVVKGSKGQIKGFVEFSKGGLLTNPAALAGAAGLMAQLAMQQTMNEITDYLDVIDEKVDAVLRAQKDAAVADMVGVDFVIEEALTIRRETGRVSDVTWSKVQAAALPIARTQAYALRQIDAIAERVESKQKIGDLAEVSEQAAAETHEWLAVLARCFQLQDAIGLLELDRVLDSAPDELDQHRQGVRAARQNRRDVIVRSTQRLIERLDAAAERANSKVLTSPSSSGVVVRSSNAVASDLGDFHRRLGIERDRDALEARRWRAAAGEVRDRAVASGASGFDAARQRGSAGFDRARGMGGRISGEVSSRVPRRRRSSEHEDEDD